MKLFYLKDVHRAALKEFLKEIPQDLKTLAEVTDCLKDVTDHNKAYYDKGHSLSGLDMNLVDQVCAVHLKMEEHVEATATLVKAQSQLRAIHPQLAGLPPPMPE